MTVLANLNLWLERLQLGVSGHRGGADRFSI